MHYIASQVSVCFNKLRESQGSNKPTFISGRDRGGSDLNSPKLVVVGSAAVDISCRSDAKSAESLDAGSTTPGRIAIGFGGVARNIAEAAHRILSARGDVNATMLISPIASDHFSGLIMSNLKSLGLREDGLLKSTSRQCRSATCAMFLDRQGELINGIADMSITVSMHNQHVRALFWSRGFM